MASAISKESAKTLLRSVLLPEKNGVLMKSVPGIYHEFMGAPLAYRNWGFNTLESYLRSIPDVVSLRRSPDGGFQCFGVADESTAHIKSLVNRQKNTKKSRGKSRPKPMFRSRPRPAHLNRLGPVHRTPPSRPAAFPRPTYRRAPPRPPPSKSFGGHQGQNFSSYRPPPSSTSRNFPNTKPQDSSQRKPLAPKSTFGNSGFTNTNNRYSDNNTKENTWGEPAKPKSTSKPQGPPPSLAPTVSSGRQPAPSERQSAPSGRQAAPSGRQSASTQGGKSAFVSVVSQDAQNHDVSSTKSSVKQRKQDPAPRVLAPRFLKQMQQQMQEGRLKDVQKENQRRMQAKNLAREHNNNLQQDLRITVPNDISKQARVRDRDVDWRHSILNDLAKQQNNNEENIESEPAREEWPRRQVTQESGDWHVSIKQEERSVTPISDSTIPEERSVTPISNTSEDQRAHSPAHYAEETSRPTPPRSPLTVASDPEDKPVCDWFKKELDIKTSGIWRSSLNADFEVKFGKSLTDDLMEKMAGLRILTVEKVFNQEIVYPNLKVDISSAHRKVVVNGSTSDNQSIRRHHSDSGSASPVTLNGTNQTTLHRPASVSNQTPLHRTTSVSSDTSSTSNPTTPIPTQTQSPVLSPPPSSPSPTMSSGSRGGGSGPDYSHLAVPLPEDEVWEVYVSYIKHLQDFYVLVVDEEYSDRLFTLEEEMGHYYKYSRRRLQGPPAVDCMYAAELNKEWLRVMVDEVHEGYISGFLVDHGDTERVDISKLQPLAPQFLHIPFQAIPCKLEGAEDDPENAEAVQKFCEVALGKVLSAEPDPNGNDAQVELVMYEDDAVATINDLCLLV